MQKKSIYFLLLKLLKFPLGILTLSLTVKQFGVSVEMDSWLIALTGITTIGLAIWGPVNETFRSKFIIIKETEGEKIALNKVRSLLFYIIIISLLGVIGIWLFPQYIIRLFSTESFYEVGTLPFMFQLLAPYLLLNQCASICTSVLNAYEIFYIPEISSAITQIINITLILLFAEQFGIYVLAIALYISSLLLLLLLLYKLRQLNVKVFTFSVLNIEGFRMFFTFSLPFFIPYFMGQLNGMVEKRIATNIGIGAVSILDFSKRIPDILNGVIISLVLTILVPMLTKLYVNQHKTDYQKAFLETYQLGLFCLIGFVALFFIEADEILKLLYGGKSISSEFMQEIIRLSKIYAVSLFGVFSYVIFGMVMLSINKGKAYALLGSLAQVISIIMNLFLVDYWGITIFPITFFVAHAIPAIFMFLSYPYKRIDIIKTTIKYGTYGLVCWYVVYQFFGWFQNSIILPKEDWILFGGAIVVTIASMFILGLFFRISEIKKIVVLIHQIFQKIIRAS